MELSLTARFFVSLVPLSCSPRIHLITTLRRVYLITAPRCVYPVILSHIRHPLHLVTSALKPTTHPHHDSRNINVAIISPDPHQD